MLFRSLDQLQHPLRIDYKEQTTIPNHSMVLSAVDQCMETFLHIITETCYWERKCHLTEKTFKPIILKQPFVLLGCAYNLEYLKSYGFKTFDQWWDESYDYIEDPVRRLQAVADIVKYLDSLSIKQFHLIIFFMSVLLILGPNMAMVSNSGPLTSLPSCLTTRVHRMGQLAQPLFLTRC